MEKKNFTSIGKFAIEYPLCTVSTIKDGDSGFIDYVDIHICEHEGEIYLQLKKDGNIHGNKKDSSMIFISQEEGEISLSALDGWYFTPKKYLQDDTYTDIIKIEYDVYESSKEDTIPSANEVITDKLSGTKNVQERHEAFVIYCYGFTSDPKVIEIFSKVVQTEIKEVILTWSVSQIYMFASEISKCIGDFEDAKEDLTTEYGIDAEASVSNLNLLGDYLRYCDAMIESIIASIKQEGLDIKFENTDFSNHTIDDLVELLNNAHRTGDEKKIIQKEIDKKIKVHNGGDRTTTR